VGKNRCAEIYQSRAAGSSLSQKRKEIAGQVHTNQVFSAKAAESCFPSCSVKNKSSHGDPDFEIARIVSDQGCFTEHLNAAPFWLDDLRSRLQRFTVKQVLSRLAFGQIAKFHFSIENIAARWSNLSKF